MNFDTTVRLRRFQKRTISVRFNLLQVCPSMPTFVFTVLLITFYSYFNVLIGYFYVSLIGGSSFCQNFDKICDKAPLIWTMFMRRYTAPQVSALMS